MESGQFHNFCRISETDFEILLCKIGPKISEKDTDWREAIPIQERLALTLRYLATGDSYTSLMYLFKVSKRLITRIVPEVCTAIIEDLEDFIKFRHPVGEIELSAAFCYELQTSGKSRPQRIPTSFDLPTSDGSLPKANLTIGLPLLRRTHVPISVTECILVAPVSSLPGRSTGTSHCRHCSEYETLPHVLGSCPQGEVLRMKRHNTIRSMIADALRSKNLDVHEKDHCIADGGRYRRIDIIAITRNKQTAEIIVLTIRFEISATQPSEVNEEKKKIYESTIQYLSAKYNIEKITVTGLFFGARGTIPKTFVKWREKYKLKRDLQDAIITTIIKFSCVELEQVQRKYLPPSMLRQNRSSLACLDLTGNRECEQKTGLFLLKTRQLRSAAVEVCDEN
ncbi:hypothetical protein ANN_12703 [Periplaneta americana]|uniref:Uncharacterized protein n=1 Tax=Periplaneta americana TaxID=6978 RepID=A0ABQ8TJ80_PERAM|nr:hypothetical protein ANN_12703 [Periplaneta americana]